MPEDMILPDDFEAPAENSVEDTTPTEQVEDVQTESQESSQPETEQAEQTSPFLKVKYNKEEMELDEATARELAQKGLNYDKVQERLQALESDPRLTLVEQLAQQQGMSVDEYVEAVRQYQEEAQLNELIQQNIPEEYAKEMLENRRFREQLQQEQQQKQQEAQQQQEFQDFFKYFKEANGRDFIPETDTIPDSVWQANQQGVPLRFAYAEHENQQLRHQLATLKKNQDNAKKAPVGGVTQHGSNETASTDPFLKGFMSI
ncbi:MAG: hypothetical protein HF312_21410 [Ignavibacteria bacterium]|jgi:hypothetical protein|nr:hypothetical protein [Ignavibacteria bacterium]